MLLWEVVTFGELPFEDLSTEDVIKMAESKELVHPRYHKIQLVHTRLSKLMFGPTHTQ